MIELKVDVAKTRAPIVAQLRQRKKNEQNPYEDLCNLASQLSDKIYTLEGENSKLSSELHSLHRILLAEGTDSAKQLFTKLANTSNVRDQLNDVDKKQITELQEILHSLQKENLDLSRSLSDMRIKFEEKEHLCNQLSTCNQEINGKITDLNKTIEHLQDENVALLCTNKSLEKQNHKLSIECDNLCKQILLFKRENAERLNAENEREQNERTRREVDQSLQQMNKVQLEPPADTIEDLNSDQITYGGHSRVPDKSKLLFEAHDGETCAINWFSQNGPRDEYLATGGCDRKVKLWKICDDEAKLIATYHGSNKSINSIDILGGNLLATSNDYASRIWSIHDTKLRVTLTGHSNKVMAAKFIGRTNVAASCSTDRTVKIWDTNNASCTRTYFAGSTSHDIVYFDSVVISGHFDGLIRFWDLRKSTHDAEKSLKLQGKITSLDLSSDGYQLICSLRDNTLRLVDIRSMEVCKSYFCEDFKIGSDTCRARFSPDTRYVACGSVDGSLYIWDAVSTKLEKVLPGPNPAMLACSWSPDGKRLVTIDKSRLVNVWG